MQQSRAERLHAAPAASAPDGSTMTGVALSRATVTKLGDHVGEHRWAESVRTFARAGDGHVAVIARERATCTTPPSRNRLLGAMNAEAYATLLPHLEFVAMPQGLVVCETGTSLDYVHFPTDGIVSLLYESENGSSVEVALVGNDGLVGLQVLMGAGTATGRAVVRNAGCGYRVRAGVLKSAFESSAEVRQPLLRYAQALLAQTTQTAVCHCHHRLEQQLARLLLSTLDRIPAGELTLTQDTMANLLGVRRESITEVAGKLQAAGLIRYRRGRIAVLSRTGLAAMVCECYMVVRMELERLVPDPCAAVGHRTAIVQELAGVGLLSESARVETLRTATHSGRRAACRA